MTRLVVNQVSEAALTTDHVGLGLQGLLWVHSMIYCTPYHCGICSRS